MNLKSELIAYCETYVDQRISEATQAIAEARKSSAAETKSSAGDKYETSREMLQGVIEQHTQQLQEARKLRENLQVINSQPSLVGGAGAGSVVMTSSGNFFLAIPAGITTIQGLKFAMISLYSPIGKLLIEKNKGDQITFNGIAYIIQDVIN